jgi:hypothetical protein
VCESPLRHHQIEHVEHTPDHPSPRPHDAEHQKVLQPIQPASTRTDKGSKVSGYCREPHAQTRIRRYQGINIIVERTLVFYCRNRPSAHTHLHHFIYTFSFILQISTPTSIFTLFLFVLLFPDSNVRIPECHFSNVWIRTLGRREKDHSSKTVPRKPSADVGPRPAPGVTSARRSRTSASSAVQHRGGQRSVTVRMGPF